MQPGDIVAEIRPHLVIRESDGARLIVLEHLADDGRLLQLSLLQDDDRC